MNTVGGILKQARGEKKVSIAQASETLKIHSKFLKALESGNYSIFAHPLHIKGFLKNYSEFLGLDSSQILAFWRREYKNASRTTPAHDVTKPLERPKIVITPGILASILTFVTVTVFLGYLFWQYRSIAGPPHLEIVSPKKDMIVSIPQIALEGTADSQARVEVNGQKILVGEDGWFSFDFILSDGTNTLNFAAENEFGKRTEVTRRIIYEKPESLKIPVPEASPAATLEATASASPNPTGLNAP